MRYLPTLLLCGILVLGCSDYDKPSRMAFASGLMGDPEGFMVPGDWEETPAGTRVWVPKWLNLPASSSPTAPGLKIEALAEIDAAGVPAGVEVRIHDPGPYSFPGSPTGLVAGHTNGRTYVTVAWRTKGTYPLLPALEHELNHVKIGPGAGH